MGQTAGSLRLDGRSKINKEQQATGNCLLQFFEKCSGYHKDEKKMEQRVEELFPLLEMKPKR